MSRFSMSLRRVCGAVYGVFETDAELNDWLSSQSARGSPPPGAGTAQKLTALLNNLETGWVSDMLVNEDKAEERSVISEAVVIAIRQFEGQTTTCADFAYRLTSAILNKGVRPLTRSAAKLAQNPAFDAPLIDEIADPHRLTDADRERIDQLVFDLVSKRRPKNEKADPKTVLAVKNVWLKAIKAIETEKGLARAKPMSGAVKEKVAAMLSLDVKTVEAAMKRLKRACQQAAKQDDQTAISSWLVE